MAPYPLRVPPVWTYFVTVQTYEGAQTLQLTAENVKEALRVIEDLDVRICAIDALLRATQPRPIQGAPPVGHVPDEPDDIER